jgi:cyclopropane-fatty-acyl-phospholipid synthase
MHVLGRIATLLGESLCFGPAYGTLKYLIRSDRPLDPERTWRFITSQRGPVLDWIRRSYPPLFVSRMLLSQSFRADHVKGIAEHYDVSNDFYELFLDRKYMFYTCADFHSESDTIEQAQTNKANHLASLIDPHPGEKILELGCGWGAMLKHLESITGDRENLYGYTLSKEQVAYNEKHNGFNVEFRNFITTDYPKSHFDKIYSIGAWEHVRKGDNRQLVDKLYQALTPEGRMVHHFFCSTSDQRPASVVCGSIFFPGSQLQSYRFYLNDFEAAGFRVAQRTVHDYRPTLRAWFDNLVANRERALQLVDVQTYNRYLVFFPASWKYFHDCIGMLVRWQLFARRGPSPR